MSIQKKRKIDEANLPDRVSVAIDESITLLKHNLRQTSIGLSDQLGRLKTNLDLISKYQQELKDSGDIIRKSLQDSGLSTLEMSLDITERLLLCRVTIDRILESITLPNQLPFSEVLGLEGISILKKESK